MSCRDVENITLRFPYRHITTFQQRCVIIDRHILQTRVRAAQEIGSVLLHSHIFISILR